MVDALIRELELRKDYLNDKEIETIYFGGGTPSLLDPNQINRIIEVVHSYYSVATKPEITLEANPEDHQARYDLAQALYAAGEGEEAIEQFFEIFRRDREWNDGAAKAQLFTIFEALKPNDPLVLNGRRKLSSMIFA